MNTKIEWCHHTFNPWFGCTKVSPACDFCYAEALMDHRWKKVQWGPHGARVKASPSYWQQPLRWQKMARASNTRARVFCASLADWLDNQAPQEWREQLADVIHETPDLDWLLLSKRPENYRKLSPWKDPPANVWLGNSAETQDYYIKRHSLMQGINATVKFISYEPALGPLTLIDQGIDAPDWIICGGESRQEGNQPRLMEESWARSIRDECAELGVAFFMKQMTDKASIPDDLMIRQFPEKAIKL